MIKKILNKYIDFTKIVGLELKKDIHTNDFYIVINIQLLEKPLILNITEIPYQSKEENLLVELEFKKALSLWKSINKPVTTTNEQPKIYKAIRDKAKDGFNEEITLYDDEMNVITISTKTHPESYFIFRFEYIEYYSQPDSKGIKPVYHRLIV